MEVVCSCNHERISTEEVEFLDIQEGPAGEDRMTFVCPFCGEDHTSVVVASSHQYHLDVDAAMAQAALLEDAYAESDCQSHYY